MFPALSQLAQFARLSRSFSLTVPALSLMAAVVCMAPAAFAQMKAFPQAEGFGAYANGGRGGDVYHVTNLGDSGSGSLRYGIDNSPSGGRTIVFDVGGWININSKLGINSNKKNITIAGQTAPGGIGIRGHQFSVGGDDIVIRHMRFRPGKDVGRVDAAGANTDAERVIYDHISAGFSYDENFSVGASDFTLQYSTVSYGLEDHSAGSLIQNAGNLSFHHNLYAHNDTRNPKARAQLIDWRDNVVYNYHNGFIAGDSQNEVTPHWRANFDGNTYISSGRPMMTGGRDYNYDLYYGTNALDRDGDSAADPITYSRSQAMSDQSVVSSAYNWVTTPFSAPEIRQSANPAAAYDRVLEEFGATPWDRDEVDQLVQQNVINRTGSRISHENQLPVENAGYPTLGGVSAPIDTDRDGMPDEWEVKHGTNPLVTNNNGDFDYDGYTDLEEYLNDVAAFPAIGTIEFTGIGRYADWKRWSNDWEPSRVDTVSIVDAAAFVDAVGQKAGTLQMSSGRNGNGRLYITSGWLEVTDQVDIDLASSRISQHGGELRVLNGGVNIGLGTYSLHAGTLRTPALTKQDNGVFEFTGGALDADSIEFDLLVEGGLLLAGQDALGTTTIDGDLSILSGGLQVDIASSTTADQFVVGGIAMLGGDLDVATIGTVDLSPGTMFEILTATSIQGDFQSISPGFATQVIGNTLWLEYAGPAGSIAVPEPPAALLLTIAVGSLLVLHRGRRLPLCGFVVAFAALATPVQAVLVTAGELVVDLRAVDLDENSTTWVNQDTTGRTTGDFSTSGGGTLNVGVIEGVRSLHVANETGNALTSALDVGFFGGNATVSIEAWLYANSNNPSNGSNGVVAWGATDPRDGTALRAFRYDEHNSNGFYSGWYGNDFGWATDPLTTSWTHVAYVYDGTNLKGYVNGVLDTTVTMSPAPNVSSNTKLQVGKGRPDDADPFDGYLADVRVHTGVLSDAQVLNNYQAGRYVGPSGVAGDYNNDGIVSLVDYNVWRNHLGGNSLMNEEVSPTIVDKADYLYWRERFGATDSGRPALAQRRLSVPEPPAQLAALVAAVLLVGTGRIAMTASCPATAVKMLAGDWH
ncbi:hypothetical protein NG895_08630 [Aeoliella sp. ICT_H6.2]|uniref:LamG-like jellyroll fold domain-containing protein n=1 Tax=Aeoliella straminimaris TaxID=2954799 RepID=A0A9X2FDP0_9BACT|nr:LamG-like jellyroll fold domain-containing protein [Aeoliella straminimaris]MCO6043971.1 hypothetical protein [Aeoliella straminimaris]